MAMQRRWKKRLLASAIGLVGGFLVLELALRCILFADLPLVRDVGYRLRHARCYCNFQDDEDYWKLAHRFGELRPIPADMYQAELGWISDSIEQGTLRHRGDAQLRGRRPILFYGDSFARCMTTRDECFEGLLERSDLAGKYALLNYGVAGYGLDQIQILIARTIDRYAPLDPIVVVGIFVDDDLDRVSARIRNWPKPSYTLRAGQLTPPSPTTPSLDEFLADHPIEIQSYAWRWILHARFWPTSWVDCITDDAEQRAFKQTVSRHILEEIERSLASRKLEHFYLVFQGETRTADDRAADWRDELVLDFLRRTHAPFVSSARYLRDGARSGGFSTAEYFGREGPVMDHYLPRANAVVFEALRDGIEQRFEQASEPRTR